MTIRGFRVSFWSDPIQRFLLQGSSLSARLLARRTQRQLGPALWLPPDLTIKHARTLESIYLLHPNPEFLLVSKLFHNLGTNDWPPQLESLHTAFQSVRQPPVFLWLSLKDWATVQNCKCEIFNISQENQSIDIFFLTSFMYSYCVLVAPVVPFHLFVLQLVLFISEEQSGLRSFYKAFISSLIQQVQTGLFWLAGQ